MCPAEPVGTLKEPLPMTCPYCESTRITKPRYGAVSGGHRLVLVRICLDCHEIIGTKKAA